MQRRCPSMDNAPAPAQTSAIHPRRSSPTARRDWAALVTKPAAEYTAAAATSWPASVSTPTYRCAAPRADRHGGTRQARLARVPLSSLVAETLPDLMALRMVVLFVPSPWRARQGCIARRCVSGCGSGRCGGAFASDNRSNGFLAKQSCR